MSVSALSLQYLFSDFICGRSEQLINKWCLLWRQCTHIGVHQINAVQALAPVNAALDAAQWWLALTGAGWGCSGAGRRAWVYPGVNREGQQCDMRTDICNSTDTNTTGGRGGTLSKGQTPLLDEMAFNKIYDGIYCHRDPVGELLWVREVGPKRVGPAAKVTGETCWGGPLGRPITDSLRTCLCPSQMTYLSNTVEALLTIKTSAFSFLCLFPICCLIAV